jgi:hypothetical protein
MTAGEEKGQGPVRKFFELRVDLLENTHGPVRNALRSWLLLAVGV